MNANSNSEKNPVEGEQEIRNLLANASSAHDSINLDHQQRLRNQMLEAFDQSQTDSAKVVTKTSFGQMKRTQWVLAAVATLAACFFCVAMWFTSQHDPDDQELAKDVQSEQADARLLAAIQEVDALGDEVPTQDFYNALMVCQQSRYGSSSLHESTD